MSNRLAIETTDLWKRYGDMDALRGLNLQVPPGSICGFLGRNGAGKTTTIKVLLGMARPTKGTARVLGVTAGDSAAGAAVRRRIGFVSDEKDLYDYMTVGEMIAFTRPFFPGWRPDLEQKYLGRFELPLGREIKELSRGMRTKLCLLLVLCRGAELLILDEPTSGLDPAMAEDVLQALVAHVAAEEMTVFFSSHQISEVDQIADRVAIIDRGQLVVEGALDDVRDRYNRVQLVFAGDAPSAELRTPGIIRARRQGRVLTVLTNERDALLADARALGPASIDVAPVTLKEIFLESVKTED
ncbi:MAG TPA: ABC transporter ATP-binding protein [Vicinamibacterales bacterium]|nr:ABC transporter ATP-binding protein [Vicinamibacterales bacterium]